MDNTGVASGDHNSHLHGNVGRMMVMMVMVRKLMGMLMVMGVWVVGVMMVLVRVVDHNGSGRS